MFKMVSFLATQFLLLLQSSKAIEMADKLRSNGKIYVVVTIMVIILIGLFVYLISLDNKLSKIEQRNSKK